MSGREGADGVSTDRVAPKEGKGERIGGDERPAPQREADHRQGIYEGGREGRVGSV